MQTLTFEEVDMVSGAGYVNSAFVGAGRAAIGYAAGGFVAGFVEGMGYGAFAGPVGVVVGGAIGGAGGYFLAHMLH